MTRPSLCPKEDRKMVFETKFSLQSFLKKVDNLTKSQRNSIERVGFGNLLKIPNQVLRRFQLIELMERWCCENRAFILHPGEITITLMDVALILGLRVIGEPVVLKDAQYTKLESEYGASLWCRRITTASIKERLESLGGRDDEDFLRSFLLFTFGTLLFPNANGKIDSRYLTFLQDLGKVNHFAWGAAVLDDLLDCLSQRKKKNGQSIGGCLILLQIWCYEHIKVGRPILLNKSFPRACRWERISRGYIKSHDDRKLCATKFRDLEHNQILWELKVTSEESEIDIVKELLLSQEFSTTNVSSDEGDTARTKSGLVEESVYIETDSNKGTGEVHGEQQLDEHRVFQENINIPSTSHHTLEEQEEQMEQQWVSHSNFRVAIISYDDVGDLDAESENLEEENIKLKRENEVLRKGNERMKKLEAENLELRRELDNLRRENQNLSLSTNKLVDRLENIVIDENVD